MKEAVQRITMDRNASETLKYFQKEIYVCFFYSNKNLWRKYLLYIPQVQIEAEMFSYFSGLVNDATLHELDMHNAGEMF